MNFENLTQYRKFLEKALEIYSNGYRLQNEAARTMHKLGSVKVEYEQVEAGEALIKEARTKYRHIRPFALAENLTEADFDALVMCWVR
jgi:hypothetical protein